VSGQQGGYNAGGFERIGSKAFFGLANANSKHCRPGGLSSGKPSLDANRFLSDGSEFFQNVSSRAPLGYQQGCAKAYRTG